MGAVVGVREMVAVGNGVKVEVGIGVRVGVDEENGVDDASDGRVGLTDKVIAGDCVMDAEDVQPLNNIECKIKIKSHRNKAPSDFIKSAFSPEGSFSPPGSYYTAKEVFVSVQEQFGTNVFPSTNFGHEPTAKSGPNLC